ncbi:non-ribosomal peptide synthetase [Streptomyces lunaelactis]|uniref:non-ribosomal peptide synthetase n=1 Tax=Streptomyces lunaelactis TaxID=1535768 RepID=UPI0015848F88|nr:non-ribosomal peptide synthetase [Streptomyces lunaelactis]NUK00333.1 amino acid adenylation domain-containing protein [Streptomyces lunaelactis]
MADLAYGRDRLEDAPSALGLPTDRLRQEVRRDLSGSVAVTLSSSITQRLDRVASAHGATHFMALMAAFKLLLSRYTGVTDISVGMPSPTNANNPLILRSRWDEGLTFAEFLAVVRDGMLDAFEHPDVLFEQGVEAVRPPHDASRTPLFQVMMAMRDACPALPLDLTLLWDEPSVDGTLRGAIEYDVDLFDRATSERFACHFVALLESALASPESYLFDLVHTTAEERALLAAWGTEPGQTTAGSVVEAFLDLSRTMPDAVALVFQDETLTYGELRARAEHMAGVLPQHGVRAESVVGLAVERSSSLVVAMLAVLLAGAAYVPLDSGHPDARLAYMVEDSRACLVIADRDVSIGSDVPVVRIGELQAQPTGSAELRPPHPEQQACVLYTSGSTGRPKGVAITHRGIVRLVRDTDYLGWGPSDVVGQVANTSFDAATFEIWGALLNGARLVGVPKHEVLSPTALGRRIEADGITSMLLTTAVFHKCVDADPAMFEPLRTLFFGGEAADARRVAAVRDAAPGVRLVNAYGPTEGTTIASRHDIGTLSTGARVAIGRPIAGTALHVLDRYGRDAGIGVPGELYMGGAGLARGYTGRPGLTAERFVPSPFGTGERLYRTGDITRWREDGDLEYLGRADTQVKIRGVRIEPDEIASVLRTCPGVREAVVAVKGEGDRRALAAYVVMKGEAQAEPRALRAFLADRLPAAMVPTWYVTLDELPVTPNGKADLKSLPEPSERDGARSETRIPPRGAIEKLVARVWTELLRLAEISAGDDFFVLGGNSLLAAQAVTRIAGELGAELSIRDMFEASTVSAFALRAAAARSAEAGLPIVPVGTELQPLSFAQQRLWFLDRLVPDSPLYNVPLALTLQGVLDLTALRSALRDLVRRHASLRTRLVDAEGGEPLQVVDEAAGIELEVEDLRHLPEAERTRTAADRAGAESVLPFDLSAGPLLRIRLLRLDERRSVLLVTMHHAISDGWSVGVLIRDLGVLYRAALGGAAEPLPPLPVQYPDYAVWQRALLDGPVRDEQLGYWRDCLADAQPVLDLPTDCPRPASPRHVGDSAAVRLPAELTARLGEVSHSLGATRFMTLLAVFKLLLGRYAGVRDVSVGTPVSGRVRPELEDMIGFFVNTLVLRSRWDEAQTFAEFLAVVREGALGAFEHQDVPFEQVVEAVRPPRDPSRTPLFQVMMAMQNVPGEVIVSSGLSVSVRESVSPVAKFDLTLVWDESSLESGALHGAIEYDVDLFDRATVERFAGHFVALLESALASPEARLRELSMLDKAELESLVGGRPPTAATGPATLLGLLAEASARWGERTAVSQSGRSLSYADLAAHSDRICAYLRARGVGAGGSVVVRMDRSLEWPAALIGVMKAGAAYVPVDAAAPQGRLDQVLADSRAVLVLGSGATGGPTTGGVPFAAVEEALHEGGPAADFVSDAVPPAATAYVLYTSGTTGTPKGVCVSQANLVHTLEAVADRYGLHPDDRVLQFASPTFDVAAEELFATLIRGGHVVLLPAGPVPGIAELTGLARLERLSVLNLPASYWHEWVAVLDQYPAADCPALRLVVVGSERVDAGRLAEWQAAAPRGVRWLNAYGPTETTITATVHEPAKEVAYGGATVPIGRPLEGVRAYALDELLRPVPPGVHGDLYLAGPGVSQGYLGDPGRTAESFLPDPWGLPGERMYATGDRVRAGADGTFEFLGRDDGQVKLRGFRIELGEVEAALHAHPRVKEAAVVLREDVPGRPVLVGYAALSGAATAAELREHLELRLPDYMVPTAIVLMEGLPRGERGKIERRALPAPDTVGDRPARVPPTSEMERLVAAVWTEVLAVEQVGSDDNFFEAGGHSLLMLRVQARLTERLGRTIPVVDLFRFPTVRSLARHLADDEANPSATGDAGRRRADARKAHLRARAPRRTAR